MVINWPYICSFKLNIFITISLDMGDSDTQESDMGVPATYKRRKRTSFFNCLRTKSPTESSEVDAFLADPTTDPTSVLKYPTVAGIYRRRNTSLPASAAVERVFSVGGQIHKPTRSRLSNEMFDKLLFPKVNSKFEG